MFSSRRIATVIELLLLYKTFSSIYNKRFIRTVLWGIPTFLVGTSLITQSGIRNSIISEIYLLDNGTEIEIGKFTGHSEII